MKLPKQLRASRKARRYQVVLFDLGHTLLYFDDKWDASFEQAKSKLVSSLQSAGIELGSGFLLEFSSKMDNYLQQRDEDHIELTTRSVLEDLLADWGFVDVSDRILLNALADMYAVTQAHWIPEEDALPTLRRLKKLDYRMGLVSNAADDENTQRLVDKLGGRNYFEVILSSAASGIRKPDPRFFLMALEAMKASPDQAVMVGDALGADIQGAKNAAIYSIWITRRANYPENQKHQKNIFPDATISALSELPVILEKAKR